MDIDNALWLRYPNRIENNIGLSGERLLENLPTSSMREKKEEISPLFFFFPSLPVFDIETDENRNTTNRSVPNTDFFS